MTDVSRAASESSALPAGPSSLPRPAELGYHVPAEWDLHQATWMSWPHNEETWPDELVEVERTVSQAIRAISTHEQVYVNVNSPEHERRARESLGEAGVRGNVRFHCVPTNDAWVRDYGPIFVVRARSSGAAGNGSPLGATIWRFNSWGEKYPPYDLDEAAGEQMASLVDARTFTGDMILEGGSVDANGAGTLLTTESCLLNANRNPHLSRDQIDERLKSYLGVERVLWLRGGIAGDDTDGHIDNMTRFVGPNHVVTAVEMDRGSENYEILQENLALLHTMTTSEGRSLRITELPMPSPRRLKGEIMPASYANFYIANGVVVVPTYGDPNDGAALALLKTCFPNREIVGLNCTSLIWGLGAFHCLTQQVPAVSLT